MRVLIVEDEPLAAERLRLLLCTYDPSIEVMDVLDSVESARTWLTTKPHPDIIFLDIELADGRCFPLLQWVHPECPIIFTTAYDQFALDAFQHFSIDYLLKPISLESVARALKRYGSIAGRRAITPAEPRYNGIQAGQATRYKSRFLVKNGSRMGFVDIHEVGYFYAEGKTVFLVHRDGRKFPVDFTLEKLEEVLDPSVFFRFNRKVIGHVGAIKDIRTYLNNRLRISLQAGAQHDEAIVSRERVQAFRQWADA